MAQKTPQEIDEEIRKKSLAHIRQYVSAGEEGMPWWDSLNSYIREAKQEYFERLIIELIQNGADALLRTGQSGKIHILLDCTEGPFGALYVANEGTPFDKEDFYSLCHPGVSSKTPGVGIGNKGIGFRSVHQICKVPEIFSQNPNFIPGKNSIFEGYCFRSASKAKLTEYTSKFDCDVDQLYSDLGPFLPAPHRKQNSQIKSFAKAGMATVVRLPIQDNRSLESTKKQIDNLKDHSMPLLLFVPKVSSLVIEIREGEKDPAFIELKKEVKAWQPREKLIEILNYQLVDLKDQGKYFVITGEIEKNRLQEAIKKSVEEDFLDERWLEWKEGASVSFACRLDGEIEDPRCYTFLPMGENAESPISAYLNAPFFTRFARLDLNLEVPLNDLIFNFAAEVCVKAILELRSVQESFIPKVCIDLLCWDSEQVERLVVAFETPGSEIQNLELIPLVKLRAPQRWGSLSNVFVWEDKSLKIFNTKTISNICEAQIVDPTLGENRLSRLNSFCWEFTYEYLEASPETIAIWSEMMASYFLETQTGLKKWDEYYSDLTILFGNSAEYLVGRKILLDEEKKLQYAGAPPDETKTKNRVSVFFPPSTDLVDEEEEGEIEDEDAEELVSGLKVPASLNKHISFMNSKLKWVEKKENRNRRTPARNFLENENLVRRYRAQGLLDHINKSVSKSTNQKLHADALGWIFNLWLLRRRRSTIELRVPDLRVPCKNGWKRSQEAFFSPKWSTKESQVLENLVLEAGAISDEIRNLGECFLRPPDQWPFKVKNLTDFTEFLFFIGVKDGLHPILSTKPNYKNQGNRFEGCWPIAHNLKINEQEKEDWIEDIRENGEFPNHPYTDYRVLGGFWKLPGQSEFNSFSSKATMAYGEQIAIGLGSWDENTFLTEIKSLGSTHNVFSWPTPLSTFLKKASWVPVSIPSRSLEISFKPVDETWYLPQNYGEQRHFSPFISPKFCSLLAEKDRRLSRFLNLGGHDWSDANQGLASIQYLTNIFLEGTVPDQHYVEFENSYMDAWVDWLGNSNDNLLDLSLDKQKLPLILRFEGRICGYNEFSELGEKIYVAVGVQSQETGLLTELGLPIFNINRLMDPEMAVQNEKQLSRLFSEYYKHPFVPVSDNIVQVKADGKTITPQRSGKNLMDLGCPWYGELIRLVFEASSDHFTQGSRRNLGELPSFLERLRLVWAQQAIIYIDGMEVNLPTFGSGVIEISDKENPTLVIQSEQEKLDWETLRKIARPIAKILGHPSMAAEFELAISGLGEMKAQNDLRPPTEEEYSKVLNLRKERITEIIKSYRGTGGQFLLMLKPVVIYFSNQKLWDRISELENSGQIKQEVVEILDKEAGKFPLSTKDLVRLCSESFSVDYLREKLKIPFADFNEILKGLGDPYKPTHYESRQKAEFINFITLNREQIMASLRTKFLPTFREGKSLEDYVKNRDLNNLQPLEAWLDKFESVPEEQMKISVNDWLEKFSAPVLGKGDKKLMELEIVREKNRKAVKDLINEALPLVPAWQNKKGKKEGGTGQSWKPLLGANEILEIMDGEGFLDFAILEINRILKWLEKNNFWPTGMPLTIDSDKLGITKKDIENSKQHALKFELEEHYRRNSIEVDGVLISTERDGRDALIDALLKGLTDDFLKSSRRSVSLKELGKPSGRVRKAKRSKGSRRIRMTNQQKADVGFAGELLAFEWLQATYNDVVRPEAWVSTNRSFRFSGNPGDDNLGYDFKVPLKKLTLFFEVKASTGSNLEIELGESEIRCAQENATIREPFRILFIPNALSSVHRKIYVLPNPFGPKGRDFFQVVGSGLKYRFDIEE